MARLEVKGNVNYSAKIVKIDNTVELKDCDNIQATIIMGNHVIISKDVKIGDVGIFFPVECSIKEIFLKHNNLYRDKDLNDDNTKTGFFEKHGRVKCVKFRGFASEGFWVSVDSLFYIFNELNVNVGDEFDHIDDVMICEKYVITKGETGRPKEQVGEKFNKLIDSQFHFHIDTELLAKYIKFIKPNDVISITEKIHGSSFIVSNILCNRQLNWKEKIAKKFGIKVVDKEYNNIYASRTIVKNKYFRKNQIEQTDIWAEVNKELFPYLSKGMTVYGEIAGFTSGGKGIQKNYDYGCKVGEHKNYIYRITQVNEDGVVIEFSALQVQQWCEKNGLLAVPELFYGKAKDLFPVEDLSKFYMSDQDRLIKWQDDFFKFLREKYLEKQCSICKNKVWAEGIVLRKESLGIESYKLKSFNFKLAESKALDSGEVSLEDIN